MDLNFWRRTSAQAHCSPRMDALTDERDALGYNPQSEPIGCVAECPVASMAGPLQRLNCAQQLAEVLANHERIEQNIQRSVAA